MDRRRWPPFRAVVEDIMASRWRAGVEAASWQAVRAPASVNGILIDWEAGSLTEGDSLAEADSLIEAGSSTEAGSLTEAGSSTEDPSAAFSRYEKQAAQDL